MAAGIAIQSVDRALAILETVAFAERGMRLTELAQRLGLKPPTVHHLARTLAAKGYLRQRPDTSYCLGPAVFRLVSGQRDTHFRRRVREAMADLSTLAPVAVLTFSETRGCEIGTVLRQAPGETAPTSPPWEPHNPYASASGLLFHAYADPATRAEIRRLWPFADYGSQHWQSEDALDAFLHEVRRKGYSAPLLKGKHLFIAAAPIIDGDGHFRGCLGLAIPKEAVSEQGLRSRLVRALIAAAQRVMDEELAADNGEMASRLD